MAYITGTVNSPGELAMAFHNELTANAELVGLGTQWTLVWGNAPTQTDDQDVYAVYKGVGSGTDSIYVGLRFRFEPANNRYHIEFRGFQGLDVNALNWDLHLNPSPARHISFESGVPITYYFAITGRRITGSINFSTYQQSFYAGFLLPLALPTEYPYPLMIGANLRTDTYPDDDHRSSLRTRNCDFWMSAYDQSVYMDPISTWKAIRTTGNDVNYDNNPNHTIHPWTTGAIGDSNYDDDLGVHIANDYTIGDAVYEPLVYLYTDFVDSGDGQVLEKGYVKERIAVNNHMVIGSIDGWSYVVGSKVAGSTITDQDLDTHLVFGSVNFLDVFAALGKK